MKTLSLQDKIHSVKIAIVIPARNEEKRIGAVLENALKARLKIVVVDDGSDDSTYGVISNFKASKKGKSVTSGRDAKLTVIGHKINLGKGAAMKTGAQAAFQLGSDAVVFMDADGQHKVEDLPKFIEKFEDGYDLIFGSRNLSYGVPFVRYIGNKMASILIAFLFGIYISDLTSGYRAISKKAYEKIKWESAGYGVETEMVIKTGKYGLKHCEVAIETVYLDSVKGVTILDAFNILIDVIRWRIKI